jgi:hypothetical protein
MKVNLAAVIRYRHDVTDGNLGRANAQPLFERLLKHEMAARAVTGGRSCSFENSGFPSSAHRAQPGKTASSYSGKQFEERPFATSVAE